MVKELRLTEDEAEYLVDILTMWIDGYEDAHRRQLTDEAVIDFDTLLQLSSGLTEQESMAKAIRDKLEGGVTVG